VPRGPGLAAGQALAGKRVTTVQPWSHSCQLVITETLPHINDKFMTSRCGHDYPPPRLMIG
jgi:hypothetical protein